MSTVKQIEMQQLTRLRAASRRVSQYLQECLNEYLSVLGPLVAPARVIGEHMEGHGTGRVVGADDARAVLEAQFPKLCRDPFKISAVLPTPVPRVAAKVKVYPWEYPYQAGNETVTITSSVSWVLAYDLPFDLTTILRSKFSGEKLQPDLVKQLVINTVVMQIAVSRQAGMRRMLHDLRFDLEERTSPATGALPFVVAHAALESFRPQDEMIQTVTQLSGKPVFQELIDPEAIQQVPDHLTEKLLDAATRSDGQAE
jgi:hypothetical protein